MKGYSTREVAEALGLPTSRILAWTRSGLIEPARGPRGAHVFSFQDLVLLRTARGLLESDVPARRVREALEALRAELPAGRPLSAVNLSALGSRVLVQDEDSLWEPGTGQLQITFPDQDSLPDQVTLPEGPSSPESQSEATGGPRLVAPSVPPSVPPTVPPTVPTTETGNAEEITEESSLSSGRELRLHRGGPPAGSAAKHDSSAVVSELSAESALNADSEVSADEWYDTAVDLEGSDPEAAVAAYRRALAQDESFSDAHLNLGRLLHEAGDATAAEAHYRKAIDASADNARAWFNLGVVLEDREESAEALEAYLESLRIDSGLAVAHFNASRLYEEAGDSAAAIHHLAQYRRLVTSIPAR